MKDTDCSHYETADGDCLTNACGGCCVKYRAEVERLLAAESRAARLAEALRESQETLALVLWAHPKGRVTVSDHHRATLPIPWEIVTYLDVDTRATVIGARRAIAAEEGK